MSPRDDPSAGSLPDRKPLRRALRECASGDTPPNVALLKLLMEALDAREAEDALREAHRTARDGNERRRLAHALALLEDNSQAFGTVKTVLRGVEHSGPAADAGAALGAWAAAFDRMALTSPEGSVALYALGNPELLRAATAEIVTRLGSWDLLGSDRTVLDLGCGIGRLTEALAPAVRHVTGVDISPMMIAHARERCAALPNVTLEVSSGRDLAGFGPETFDLIVAADVFPYLVQIGSDLVAAHVNEAARVLRPGGSLVVLNMSYRDDLERDRSEIEALAGAAGLVFKRHGVRDFTLWDATTFHLGKPLAL